jgi:hypothetical protein
MYKKQSLHVLFALAILSLLAACGPADLPAPEPAERNPFSLQTTSEDGAEVRWEAYANGYQPGASDTMRLSISNSMDQAWHGRLCAQLVEPMPSVAVYPLAERAIDLQSGVGFEEELSIVIPDELPPGTYGLALVIHRPAGPAVKVVPIQVGDGVLRPPEDPWPTEAALRACPAP